MTTEPRTTNYKPPLVLPSVRIVFTCCGASLLRNTVCSSFRPPAALRLEYPPHQLKPAAPGIHRPPLGLSAFLPPSSLTLHPWPITHHSSPPTFYPLPLIIKLAAAVVLWIYYSPNVAYRTCPGQAPAKTFIKKSAQKYSFMQNKPNFPRFCAKNSYLEEKQTQFKPNQSQFFTSFFLPILPVLSKAEGPINPNQTQSKTTPTILTLDLLRNTPALVSLWRHFDLLRIPLFCILMALSRFAKALYEQPNCQYIPQKKKRPGKIRMIIRLCNMETRNAKRDNHNNTGHKKPKPIQQSCPNRPGNTIPLQYQHCKAK